MSSTDLANENALVEADIIFSSLHTDLSCNLLANINIPMKTVIVQDLSYAIEDPVNGHISAEMEIIDYDSTSDDMEGRIASYDFQEESA